MKLPRQEVVSLFVNIFICLATSKAAFPNQEPQAALGLQHLWLASSHREFLASGNYGNAFLARNYKDINQTKTNSNNWFKSVQISVQVRKLIQFNPR